MVEAIWDYEASPNLYCFSLGNVNRLPGGNTLVNFSVNGQIDEVGADGEVVWQLAGNMGVAFGYSHWVPMISARPVQ